MAGNLKIKNFSFTYAEVVKPSIKKINMEIRKNKVTAFIGPSGCGKSTLLRSLNKIHSLHANNIYDGEILLNGQSILDPTADDIYTRTHIGMVFQKPTAFPMSIYDNIAYGPRLQGIKNKTELNHIVESTLKGGALWNEVKNRLHTSALGLSGGQQQRLCIARAIAIEPEILLLDEPTSALDPISTNMIEDLVKELKSRITIAIVTHNMQQAQRISDYTAFMYLGELIEFDATAQIFTAPKNELTENYIHGKFG